MHEIDFDSCMLRITLNNIKLKIGKIINTLSSNYLNNSGSVNAVLSILHVIIPHYHHLHPYTHIYTRTEIPPIESHNSNWLVGATVFLKWINLVDADFMQFNTSGDGGERANKEGMNIHMMFIFLSFPMVFLIHWFVCRSVIMATLFKLVKPSNGFVCSSRWKGHLKLLRCT